MNIVTKINDWQTLRKSLGNKTLGYVATMGHLHAGHLSLCERAQQENALTVVSIFVNPAQFNNPEDLKNYPQTLEQDKQLLTEQGIDYLFIPDAAEMYADNFQIQINETELSTVLEGKYRPGHFTGMLTVVLKLLNLMQATRTYFGEKDFQQLLLVKKMAAALFLPTEVIGCTTLRATDGLALSSRNSRLNAQQRLQAATFAQLLKSTAHCAEIKEKLEALGFKVDYIAELWQRRLGAVWLDEIRLIDNVPLTER